MTYQIIKNAPPLLMHGNAKYPLHIMDVNDAFDLPVDAYPKILWATNAFGRRYGKKFSVRKHGDGYRCQRVA